MRPASAAELRLKCSGTPMILPVDCKLEGCLMFSTIRRGGATGWHKAPPRTRARPPRWRRQLHRHCNRFFKLAFLPGALLGFVGGLALGPWHLEALSCLLTCLQIRTQTRCLRRRCCSPLTPRRRPTPPRPPAPRRRRRRLRRCGAPAPAVEGLALSAAETHC